ncbi:HEPN domain-containing protein [Bradyrhizobium arachidis]|uniref:HEPN domain-containing protein n=1 Tax=Bradyrhizobium arachidis TaxID=858423 RepID=UPI002163409F|nr:HEPN domain-containing protein [Bradyrhizobium arachidis]UVO30180.1 hypothetical protein KUF59_05280 [Bradyrhizobium arachidis]
MEGNAEVLNGGCRRRRLARNGTEHFMAALEERGLFWWHHELLPERHFAPDTSVSGLLKIDEEGRIKLELDGRLHTDKGPMSVLDHAGADLEGRRIEGILKGSNKRVLLFDLMKHGGQFSSNGLSFEGYLAMHCLIGEHPLPRTDGPMRFGEFEIDLTGLEEWMRLGSIEISRTETTISAVHERQSNIEYAMAGGKLALNYQIYGPFLGKHRNRKVELREAAVLRRTLAEPRPLDDLRMEFGLFEDLFVLLTDCEYSLKWPSIHVKDGDTDWAYKWYFLRLRPEADPPRYYESPTNLVQLRDRFGDIVSSWMSKREEFGPGFYLYLAVRRGMKFYPEHRFVNMIWGLEALHRKQQPDDAPTEAEAKMKAKVARIIDQVEAAKDKKWLEKRLRNAHEPNLEQRVFDLFSGVPIKLDSERVRAFATRCQQLRNEISHFGSQRHGHDYQKFVHELSNMSDALAILYHTLILHEIGIEAEILCWWIYESPVSFQRMRTLAEAGLLDPEMLKPAHGSTGAKPA